MDVRCGGVGIIDQVSAESARRLLCLYRRLMAHLRGFGDRPEPACAEFHGTSLKELLVQHLRDSGASEKLYAVRVRVTRMVSG